MIGMGGVQITRAPSGTSIRCSPATVFGAFALGTALAFGTGCPKHAPAVHEVRMQTVIVNLERAERAIVNVSDALDAMLAGNKAHNAATALPGDGRIIDPMPFLAPGDGRVIMMIETLGALDRDLGLPGEGPFRIGNDKTHDDRYADLMRWASCDNDGKFGYGELARVQTRLMLVMEIVWDTRHGDSFGAGSLWAGYVDRLEDVDSRKLRIR
jgi:hypothetical protein